MQMPLTFSRRNLKLIGIGTIVLVAFVVAVSLLGASDRQTKAGIEKWDVAAHAAPAGLMEQVRIENLSADMAVDPGRMGIRQIQSSGQTQPLYLINARIRDAARLPHANPLCGAAECAFFGYIPIDHQYQKVFAIYLNPRLPPGVPLFEPAAALHNGLPVLKVNQLEGDRIRQFTLSFDGKQYEVIETQLLQQTYD